MADEQRIAKLPEPPRFALVDEQGVLTEQGRRWFDTFYKKIGGAGEIPSESLSAKSVVNISNDAMVDWVDVNAASGTVRVYGPGGVGSSWNRFEGTATGFRTVGPFLATTITGKAYNQRYYVAYDPMTSLYLCATDYRETLRDGLFFVGRVKASASFGGGGSQSGGGGSADGGVGGSGDEGDGFGVLL